MPARSLPENPSLENLKKQAKGLGKAVRAADAGALARVREFHPKAEEAIADFKLSDAQLVTARGHGFVSWSKLKRHLEVVERFTFDPWSEAPADASTRSSVDAFLRLACLTYGNWSPAHAEKAGRLLAEHPELAAANIYAAAAVGDVSSARAMLARVPALVSAKGGPLGWAPLLYASYSRLTSRDPHHSTLEVARLLLSAGADPNAGFLWRGNVPPFTALTGAFGEGEDAINQPPHPHRDALARLLLDAGADPNDEQTLYNRHFNRNDEHLKLLLAYGLGRDKGGPWLERFGDRMTNPAGMLAEELWAAARKNFPERVRLLVEHGVDVNAPGRRDGRTPYQAAMRADNREVAQYLLEHGAKKIDLDIEETFAVACIAGRRAEAMALLGRSPKLVEKLGRDGRIKLMHRAVEANRPEGIRLMASLGFETSGTTGHDGVGVHLNVTPLHNAAGAGNLELVKLLMELGAEPNVLEPNFHATPLGWAAHGHHRDVVDFLMPFATIFDAVRGDGVERVRALLQEDPSLAKVADEDGNPLVFCLHAGLGRLDEMIDLLRSCGADLDARDKKGKTLLDEMIRRGSDEVARALRRHGAKTADELTGGS